MTKASVIKSQTGQDETLLKMGRQKKEIKKGGDGERQTGRGLKWKQWGVVSTTKYDKGFIPFCQSNKLCPYVICMLRGLESIWGLGTPLRRITTHCQVFTLLPELQRYQRNDFKHDQICTSSVERAWGEKQKNIDVVFDDWNRGCSVHMVVRGRKGAGEADQAMPKGWTWRRRKQHSAPRWDLRSCCLYVSLSVSIGCLIACCIYLCLSVCVPVQLTCLEGRQV